MSVCVRTCMHVCMRECMRVSATSWSPAGLGRGEWAPAHRVLEHDPVQLWHVHLVCFGPGWHIKLKALTLCTGTQTSAHPGPAGRSLGF